MVLLSSKAMRSHKTFPLAVSSNMARCPIANLQVISPIEEIVDLTYFWFRPDGPEVGIPRVSLPLILVGPLDGGKCRPLLSAWWNELTGILYSSASATDCEERRLDE